MASGSAAAGPDTPVARMASIRRASAGAKPTFTINGKLYSGFRYTRPGGKPEYFSAEGRPLVVGVQVGSCGHGRAGLELGLLEVVQVQMRVA